MKKSTIALIACLAVVACGVTAGIIISNSQHQDPNGPTSGNGPAEPAVQIAGLDDFYQHSLVRGKDLRELAPEYGAAEMDNDRVYYVGSTETRNSAAYNEFWQKYQAGESAFLRIAQTTVEGDLILRDVLYLKETGKIYVVSDNSRDRYASPADQEITFAEFAHLAEHTSDGRMDLVAYNGALDAAAFESGRAIVIAPVPGGQE